MNLKCATDGCHFNHLCEENGQLKEMLKHLQHVEMEFTQAKQVWDTVKGDLEMLAKDKYAGPQKMKHVDRSVNDVLTANLNYLKQRGL